MPNPPTKRPITNTLRFLPCGACAVASYLAIPFVHWCGDLFDAVYVLAVGIPLGLAIALDVRALRENRVNYPSELAVYHALRARDGRRSGAKPYHYGRFK
jgi:hypothetical protein